MAGMTDEPRGVSLDRTYGQLRAERALRGSRQSADPTARLARQEQIERLLEQALRQLDMLPLNDVVALLNGIMELRETVRHARRLLARLSMA